MEDNKKTLSILTRLLGSEDSKNEFYNAIENIKKIINNNYIEAIEKSSYPRKTRSIKELRSSVENIENLFKYPFLIGKTNIGILSGSKKARRIHLKDIVHFQNKKDLIENVNIPIIYTSANEDKISLFNQFEKEESFLRKEANEVFDLEKKQKVDLNSLLDLIVVKKSHDKEKINFIDLNVFNKENRQYNKIFGILDVVIFIENERGNILNLVLDYLDDINFNKEVIIIKNDTGNSINISFYRDYNIKIMDIYTFSLYINSLNENRKNLSFPENIENIFLDIESYLYCEKNKNNRWLKMINQYIVLTEDEDTFKEIKEKKLEEIECGRNLTLKLNEIRTKILEEYNKNIYKTLINKASISEENEENELLYLKAKKYLELEKYLDSRELIQKLCKNDYKKVYTLILKYESQLNISFDCNMKQYIKNYIGTEQDIIRVKIEYHEKLGLNTNDIYKDIFKLKTYKTSKECFILGDYYSDKEDMKNAIFYYKLSLEKGEELAGDKLLYIYQKVYKNIETYIKEYEYLGDLLNNKANFELGKYYYKNKKIKKGKFYLKLSSIYGNEEAINLLVNIAIEEKNADEALAFLNLLLKNEKYNEYVNYMIGKIYFYKKDYISAYEYLNKCTNEGEAFMLIGQMFEYGYGRMKNIDEAIKWYEKAIKHGNLVAKSSLAKLQSRKEKK